METINDKELAIITQLLEKVEQFEAVLAIVSDKDEYRRIRQYINSRCLSEPIPFDSPFITN